MARKIVAITQVDVVLRVGRGRALVALADDGTLWQRTEDGAWDRQRGLPQTDVEEAVERARARREDFDDDEPAPRRRHL